VQIVTGHHRQIAVHRTDHAAVVRHLGHLLRVGRMVIPPLLTPLTDGADYPSAGPFAG
jgi:hypothetical protein